MFEFDLNVTGDGGDKIGEEFFSDVTGGKMTVFSSAKKNYFLFQKCQFQNQSDLFGSCL